MFAFLSAGADAKASTRGGGARQRDDGAPLETLAQLGDALHGVGAAVVTVNTAELVVVQTARVGVGGVNGP